MRHFYKISLFKTDLCLISQRNFKTFKQIEGYFKAIPLIPDLHLYYLFLCCEIER